MVGKWGKVKKKRFNAGDVLYGSLRPYFRKVYKPKFNGVCSTDITVIRAKNNCNNTYLFYLIASQEFISKASNAGNGTKMPRAGWNIIKKFILNIPDRTAQNQIASILSAYDDLIENNEKRIKILEEMARLLYIEWFVKFKFPGHEKVKMVDSGTEYGKVPEGWEVKPLEDVCSCITDGSHFSPVSVEKGKKMASVKDMHNWGIDIDNCKTISEEDYEALVKSGCRPQQDDVLIAKDGSYLKHAFVYEKGLDMVILSSIAILRPNGKMLPNQLSIFLKLPHVKEMMKGYVSGVAIPRIVLKDFRRFKVVVPPIQLQTAWAQRCDRKLELCRKLVKENERLSQMRDNIIPQMVTGKGKVK